MLYGLAMTIDEHYDRAEALLAEGEKVAEQIASLAIQREAARVAPVQGMVSASRVQNQVVTLTTKMDELGKKAMSIWAQAQVHATLATVRL